MLAQDAEIVDSAGPEAQHGFDVARPESVHTLEVIFKIAERCNIDCSYCYYFHLGDSSALERPRIVSPEVVSALGDWIVRGCQELRIPRVRIAFHGGEPMLVPPAKFHTMCEALRSKIAPLADLGFAIQTNGTILNDAWLALFAEFDIAVGVSIDGDRVAHDRYRLDRHGRSTFDATMANLRRFQAWAAGDPRKLPSTISVIDSANDYRRIYRFLRGLGITRMSFLLPDRNAEDPDGTLQSITAPYGKALLDIFQAWLDEDDPDVYVRFISEALAYFDIHDVPPPESTQHEGRTKKRVQIVVARSDGTVAVDDTYLPALAWYSQTPTAALTEVSLRQFLSHAAFGTIEQVNATLPTACQSCQWKAMCRGGDLENRWSAARGFDNPSAYCSAYKTLFAGICRNLTAAGYPPEILRQRFDFQECS
jgi:uncharacterized protein